jgi:hypothetical protein
MVETKPNPKRLWDMMVAAAKRSDWAFGRAPRIKSGGPSLISSQRLTSVSGHKPKSEPRRPRLRLTLDRKGDATSIVQRRSRDVERYEKPREHDTACSNQRVMDARPAPFRQKKGGEGDRQRDAEDAEPCDRVDQEN